MNKTVITVLIIIAAAVLVALTMSKPSQKPIEPVTPGAENAAPVVAPAAEGQSLGERALQEQGISSDSAPYTGPKTEDGSQPGADAATAIVVTPSPEAPADAAAPATAPAVAR